MKWITFVPALVLLLVSNFIVVEGTAKLCPSKCICRRYKKGKLADCSNQKLTSIPKVFPPDITKLVLDKNLITRILDSAFNLMPHLEEISLKSNKIIQVTSGAFTGLVNLTKVQLTSNNLDTFPPDVFRENKKIQELYLTSNFFKNIPDLEPLPATFKTLGLDANKVKTASVPKGYAKVTSLSLVLNNNQIKKVVKNDFMSVQGTLRVLKLSHCGLETIENGSLAQQPKLKSFSIGFNPALTISNLRSIFTDLKTAEYLNLLDLSGVFTDSKHLEDDIFDSLAGKKRLYILHMARNSISVLPANVFNPFQNLTTLYLGSSDIGAAEEGAFKGLKNCRRIDLSFNKLVVLNRNMFPDSLENLDLSNNNLLTDLPGSVFSNLNKLKRLNMRSCGFTQLHTDSFTGLGNVEMLDLSHNKVVTIPGNIFQPMTSLKSLSLQNNRMTMIQHNFDVFKNLDNLEKLDISSNGLSTLPTATFSPLKNLVSLNLQNNELGQIINKGTSALFLFQQKLQILNLAQNGIVSIPDNLFSNLKMLNELNLSNNLLLHWGAQVFNHTTSLKHLHMDHNQISLINKTSVLGLEKVHNWNLSENPFDCGCDLRWFRRWLNGTSVTFDNLNEYKCTSPTQMSGVNLLNFNPDAIVCWQFPWYYALAGGIFGVLIIITLLGSVIYRFRWRLRYKWYMYRRPNASDQEELQPFTYDAFICFSWENPDRKWIDNYLLPAMDDQFEHNAEICEHGARFKLWHDERDLDKGKGKAEVFEAINHSSKLLFVISNKFFNDSLCKFILGHLVPNKIAESRLGERSVIFVILDPESDLQIPEHLYLNFVRNMARWTKDPAGQKLFWQQLRDQLELEEN